MGLESVPLQLWEELAVWSTEDSLSVSELVEELVCQKEFRDRVHLLL